MRMMLKVSIPVEEGNAAVKNGSLGRIFAEAMERLKPEAAYFLAEDGKRTGMMVFDMKDTTDIPGIAEPFFMGFNADLSLLPVMNAEDLKAGLTKVS
jgi:hypothetical protein